MSVNQESGQFQGYLQTDAKGSRKDAVGTIFFPAKIYVTSLEFHKNVKLNISEGIIKNIQNETFP